MGDLVNKNSFSKVLQGRIFCFSIVAKIKFFVNMDVSESTQEFINEIIEGKFLSSFYIDVLRIVEFKFILINTIMGAYCSNDSNGN